MPFIRRFWRPWLAGWAFLAIVMTIGEVTMIDISVQDFFFNEDTGKWLTGRRDPIPRALFYTGPKYAVILLGVGLITLLLGKRRWREHWHVTRLELGVAIGVMAIVPSLVGVLKDATGVYCPWDIRRYGGTAPYIRVFENHPMNDLPANPGRGFPAGHASGGFALIGLLALAKTRRQRKFVVLLALAMGWWMGTYQLAKGAHYLSHNFVTMGIAWLVYVPLSRGFNPVDVWAEK